MTASGDTSGTLGETPLTEILVQALDRRWNGVVEFDGDREGTVIEFVAGQPARVIVPDGYAALGELLVERGLVTRDEVDEALARPGFLLGEALVEAQKLDAELLERVLMLQVLTRMVRLFEKPEDRPTNASWRFLSDDDRFATHPPPSRVDSLRVLSAAATIHGVDEARADLILALLDDAPLVLREGARVERFAFTGAAGEIVTFIEDRKPSYAQLLAAEVAPEEYCRAVVYLLATTRFLRQGEDAHAASRERTARPASHAGTGGSTGKLLSKITLRRLAVSRSQLAAAQEADGPLQDAVGEGVVASAAEPVEQTESVQGEAQGLDDAAEEQVRDQVSAPAEESPESEAPQSFGVEGQEEAVEHDRQSVAEPGEGEPAENEAQSIVLASDEEPRDSEASLHPSGDGEREMNAPQSDPDAEGQLAG